MLVAIAHTAAIQKQRMIQERSVTILCGLQLFHEVREYLHVILIDLCKTLHV